MEDKKVLAIIPARGGSKRIPNKNIKKFLGHPLIAYTILQAQNLDFIDRIIVDTDSSKIADISRKYGVEVPYLRPKHLATDRAQVVDSIIFLLDRLQKDENYYPTHIMILQTTSPLREIEDIKACWELMQKTNATTVLTVAPTHPRLYWLNKNNNIILANKSVIKSTNIQDWPPAYLLNGCFVYIIKTSVLLKENKIITKNTKAVICDKWRSIDLDTQEEWALAELIYKNKKTLKQRIKII